MNKLKFVLAMLIVTLLTGCATLGLPPMNVAKGKISNGIYTGKIGQQPGLGSFSVKVPQANNNYEFSYMQMHEIINSNNTYVSFGPAALDFSIYRVMIGARKQEPFEKAKAEDFPRVVSFLTKAYGQPIQQIYQENILYQGHSALYAVYTQTLPSYFDLTSLHEMKGVTLTHAIYYINYGKYLVVLSIMGSSGGGINAINDANRHQIIKRTWQPQAEFVNSFHLYA